MASIGLELEFFSDRIEVLENWLFLRGDISL